MNGGVQIGFSINEILAVALVTSAAVWFALYRRQRMAATGNGVPPGEPKSLRAGPGTALFAALFAVVALLFTCRVALADWPKVPTGSMEPTLRVGDYLLVNHLAYGPRLPFTNTAIEWGQPQRGDVVVFRFPLDVSTFYVKRLVGLPGDVVAFEDGAVRVNGAPFDVQVVSEGTGADVASEDRGQWLLRETAQGRSRTIKVNPFVMGRAGVAGMAGQCSSARPGAWQCTVPKGEYLMMGDNRDNSADSRDWGFLPHAQVYGKAVRVLFNLQDRSRLWTAL